MNFFRMANDTIIFYLDDVGDITIKARASYYRKSSIDKKVFNFKEKVIDYYINDKKAYENFPITGSSFSKVNFFYKNGRLKSQGFYKNSLRDSIWNFYYSNGNIEKVVLYNSNIPTLNEFYKKNGNVVFNDGNGKYKTSIIPGYKQTTKYYISGNIKKGKFNDKWKLTGNSSAVEYFDNGNFIKGSSYGFIYKTDPKISLTGFNLHENVDIFKFISIPKTTISKSIVTQSLKYKESNNLDSTLKTELIDNLIEKEKENHLLNYWCFIQFNISKLNKIENIKVYSNKDIISNNVEHFISNLKGFETVKSYDKPVDCAVYLSFYMKNGVLYIPDYNIHVYFLKCI